MYEGSDHGCAGVWLRGVDEVVGGRVLVGPALHQPARVWVGEGAAQGEVWVGEGEAQGEVWVGEGEAQGEGCALCMCMCVCVVCVCVCVCVVYVCVYVCVCVVCVQTSSAWRK